MQKMSVLFHLVTVFAVICSVLTFDHTVVPNCEENEEICEFNWNIDYLETMVYYSDNDNPRPVVVRDGILQKRLGCDEYTTLNDTELERVVTAEGSYKLLYAINGQVPGPSIVVYEGQQVVVHMKNNMLTEGVTIHWHGMVQRGTPWMDGVGTISQCPINAGETFTYRWIAEPIGTHWYHAHLGTERTDGLAGALIVLPKDTEQKKGNLTASQIFDKEYVMVLQDWKYSPSIEVNQEINWGFTGFLRDLNDSECYIGTQETDGGAVGLTAFESGVINGKGHYFINNTMEPDIPTLPYETFVVEPYKYYRFRVINTGMVFAFRLSFDQHDVQVISVDGNEIEEEGAESVIIHSAERTDIVIYTQESVNNYWIRAETLENERRGETITPAKTLGVLRYKGAPNELPNTQRRQCTDLNRCKVINCPFRTYPDSYFTDCKAISELKSTKETLREQPVPVFDSPEEFEEIFINFHFSSTASIPFTPSVNGHNFLTPSAPPQIYPTSNFMVDCSDMDCTDYCRCTHMIQIPLNKVVQIVLLNIDDAPFAMPHPVHMHGHHFHVLKTGYPEYDTITGRITQTNQDILCDTSSCNAPTWRNASWQGGNVPDINLNDPPLKDTIMVPGGGYHVLRIRSDNPGYWFMHCHIEIHQIQGMAVVLREGDDSDMAPTPERFPSCGNFEFSAEEFDNIRSGKKRNTDSDRRKQGVQVFEEVIEETYVNEEKPRDRQRHRHTYHRSRNMVPEFQGRRFHQHGHHGYVIISKSIFILLVVACALMSFTTLFCCCSHCMKKRSGQSKHHKKQQVIENIQDHFKMSGKSDSKRNLVSDYA